MPRRLISTRRTIPLDRLEEYFAAWERLRAAVLGAGGHAWVFRGAERMDHFLEFIEAMDMDVLLGTYEVRAALDDVQTAFGADDAESWEEATGA